MKKTYVIFKDGLCLECSSVNMYTHNVYIYMRELPHVIKVQWMNFCFTRDWECTDKGEDALCICVKKDEIKEFATSI